MLKRWKWAALAVVLAGAFSPAVRAAENPELKANQLNWKLTRYCKIVDRDGKQFLQVDVPKDAKDVNRQNCAFAIIDLKPFAGKTLQASVRVRGRNVSKPPQPYNGVKFLLYYKSPKRGEQWPGAVNPQGTFDWRETKIVEDILPDAAEGVLRLGLQDSSGQAEFDLSTFRFGVLGEETEKVPVTPETAKELDLIESRMRERLLTVAPISK